MLDARLSGADQSERLQFRHNSLDRRHDVAQRQDDHEGGPDARQGLHGGLPRRVIKPSDVAAWIVQGRFRTLNVAGNRESRSPGIGGNVEKFLADVFARLQRGVEPLPPAPPSGP
jgi:hypothetical protein